MLYVSYKFFRNLRINLLLALFIVNSLLYPERMKGVETGIVPPQGWSLHTFVAVFTRVLQVRFEKRKFDRRSCEHQRVSENCRLLVSRSTARADGNCMRLQFLSCRENYACNKIAHRIKIHVMRVFAATMTFHQCRPSFTGHFNYTVLISIFASHAEKN